MTDVPTRLPYTDLASIYDRVYAWKDYRREARSVDRLIRRFGPKGARTLLDVACGTGSHLRFLASRYTSTGLDASAPMLRVARGRVPSAKFVLGRMPRFDLGVRFDAITCLFSAIGYVRTPRALRATLRTFARHLVPEGVVIIEPWLTPAMWHPGSVHLSTVSSETVPIARMNDSRTVRGRSVLEMHYLVPIRGAIRHWTERHDLGLFSPAEMIRAFRDAGFEVRRIPSGFYGPGHTDRGLYMGRLRPENRARLGPRPRGRRGSSARPRRGKGGH